MACQYLELLRERLGIQLIVYKCKLIKEKKQAYQQGVPTNVFRIRCLSPESNRQAETPKSPSLIAPRASMRIFPAYRSMYR